MSLRMLWGCILPRASLGTGLTEPGTPPAPLTAKRHLDHIFNVVSTIYLSYFKSFPRLYPVQWGKGRLVCPSRHLLSCIY